METEAKATFKKGDTVKDMTHGFFERKGVLKHRAENKRWFVIGDGWAKYLHETKLEQTKR